MPARRRVRMKHVPRVGALIVGAQKSGTTALWTFLGEHPDILTPPRKELHFFDDTRYFAGAVPDYDAYHAMFCVAADAPAAVWLEATPIYMYWSAAPMRIAAYNMHMKIIVVLRDPVARAVSQWRMEFARGNESRPFEAALAAESEHRRRYPDRQDRVLSYFDRGLYSVQIERLLGCFPQAQILVLKHEDLLVSHAETLAQVTRFLSVRPFGRVPTARLIYPTDNKAALPLVSLAVRGFLREGYAADLQRLHLQTGIDVDAWLTV